MIEKIANNKTNQEKMNLNPPEKVKEKLDYYRSLFGKIQDLSDNDFENLRNDVHTFFNLKPVVLSDEYPKRLIRISNNNRICKNKNIELSFLTEISELLAPPIDYCDFGRCNIPNQQVLYCATSEAGAYWETKPQKGDVITLSYFELKQDAKIKCGYIKKEKRKNINNTENDHPLQIVYNHLDEFFLDVFSLEISRERPRDYLFSGLLSSDQLFYPIPSEHNIEAIIYPSVQKKKFGQNFAIRNDLIFEKYNLIGVETRFILDEYENINPESDELLTDNLIGSFATETFDFHDAKIIYNEDAPRIFKLFRELQLNGSKQVRIENPENIKNIAFNLSAKKSKSIPLITKKYGRNDKVNVVYQNGTRKDNVKHKLVEKDIQNNKCRITNY